MHKEPPKFSNTPSKIKKITVKNRNKQNKLFSKNYIQVNNRCRENA